MDRISPEEIARRRNSLRGGQSGEGAQQLLQDTEMPPPDAAAERAPEIEGAREAFRTLEAAFDRLLTKVSLSQFPIGTPYDVAVRSRVNDADYLVFQAAAKMREVLGREFDGSKLSADELDKIRNAIAAVDGVSAALDAIVVQEKIEAPSEAEVRGAFSQLMYKLTELSAFLINTPESHERKFGLVPSQIMDPAHTSKSNIKDWLRDLRAVAEKANVPANDCYYYQHLPAQFAAYLDPEFRNDSRDSEYLTLIRDAVDLVPELVENIDTYIAEQLGGVPSGGSPEAGESLEARARDARDKIHAAFASIAVETGFPIYLPTQNSRIEDIAPTIRAICTYVNEQIEKGNPAYNALSGSDVNLGRVQLVTLFGYASSPQFYESLVENPISRLQSTLDDLERIRREVIRDKENRSFDADRLAQLVFGAQGARAAGDAPPPRPFPLPPRTERGPGRRESPERRERMNLQRELFEVDPLSGEQVYMSPIFDAYLRQVLTHDGQMDQWSMLIERVNSIVMDRQILSPRDAGIVNPPHPLTEAEYIGYIRHVAERTRRFMNLERQKTGTITFDSGDTLEYAQTLTDDDFDKVVIQVPRSMRSSADAELPDVEGVEFSGISLSEAVLALIQQVGLTGSDGKPCTYSRAIPNPLRKERVPFTSWIMSFVPGTRVWRSQRRTRNEQIGRREAARRERQSGRLKGEMEERALRDLGNKVGAELHELLSRGVLTEDEISEYLALHDEVSTYLRRPFGDISPRQKEIEAKVTEALENLRAEPVLAQLRARGLQQVPDIDRDNLENARRDVGDESVDAYLVYVGAGVFGRFMKFPKGSPEHESYEEVQKYLDEHRPDAAELRMQRLREREPVGRALMQSGDEETRAELEAIDNAFRGGRLDADDLTHFLAAVADVGNSKIDLATTGVIGGVLSAKEKHSIRKINALLAPIRRNQEASRNYERGREYLLYNDPATFRALEEAMSNGDLDTASMRAYVQDVGLRNLE